MFEARNYPILYDSNDLSATLGCRDSHSDLPTTGFLIFRMLPFPFLVNLVEIKNELIITKIFRKHLAVAVNNITSHSGVPDGDTRLTRNELTVVFGVDDLMVVKTTQQGPAAKEHDCG